MGSERYSRNEALFGAEGQARLAATSVAICGLGGLGSHVAQQLAHLGVVAFTLIDFDIVTDSSLNRLVGVFDADVNDELPKVEAAERMITSINPHASVTNVPEPLMAIAAREALASADIIFGCLDKDLHRVELLGVSSECKKPLFDLATDVGEESNQSYYGGRMVLCRGAGCLVCLPEILDQEGMAVDRMDPEQREAHRRIYGVSADALEGTGPSVVSINGVVASLAVTEFMCLVTGLRPPCTQLTFRAEQGGVVKSLDQGDPDCLYCHTFASSDAKR